MALVRPRKTRKADVVNHEKTVLAKFWVSLRNEASNNFQCAFHNSVNKVKSIIPQKLPQQTISFFALPAEIRNKVYELALISDKLIEIPVAKAFAAPALLRASRQVENEASQLYCANNVFHTTVDAENTRHLMDWLIRLGPANVQAIRYLSISCELSPYLAKHAKRHELKYDESVQTPFALVKPVRKNWQDFAEALFATGLTASAVHIMDPAWTIYGDLLFGLYLFLQQHEFAKDMRMHVKARGEDAGGSEAEESSPAMDSMDEVFNIVNLTQR